MEVNQSLLRFTLVLTLCVTLGQGHIVYDRESSQTMAQMLDLEKFFQLQDEINAITEDIEPLKDLSLEVKQGIRKLFFILNNLLEFLGTHFQYTCPLNTCMVGKKCIYAEDTSGTYAEGRDLCGDAGAQLYLPPLPPYFPSFTTALTESCPNFPQEQFWFGNYHEVGVGYFLTNKCVIPQDLYDTGVQPDEGGETSNTFAVVNTRNHNSTKIQTRSGTDVCDNLVLDAPLSSEVPFVCPAGSSYRPLCEIDAIYTTFNSGANINQDPTDEQLQNVNPHEVHEMLRSGLEFVSFLKDAFKK